jgi:hypothetical protein
MASPARPDPAELDRLFQSKAGWHRRRARLSLPEKVRLLLEMQRAVHPLIARKRELAWWERPWETEP